jgi:hypothetical protein
MSKWMHSRLRFDESDLAEDDCASEWELVGRLSSDGVVSIITSKIFERDEYRELN